ncbi:MAG: TonB-dependent receptor [Acidobacteriaceae bacterium]
MRRGSVYVYLVVLLLASFASAQTFRGSITGTVTDSSGAAINGAEVKVVSDETGLTRTVVTNSDGFYTASELPPGNYSVTITKTGFRSATAKSILVTIAVPARVNIALTPGQVQESVTVQADVPLIETTSNTMGGTIEGKTVEDLPVNGRDFTKLLVLVPGATGDPVGSSDSPGSFGLFSVNGNRGRSNNYLLDGTDMNDGYRNLPSINEAGVFGTPATVLPVDALAEVPVISGGDAEYGRNSGGIVNLVTRSGTNTVHGSIYGFFRDSFSDARNYFNTVDQEKNSFHNDQFGLSLGGPIVKDKTFWFLSYEGQREHGALPTPGFVPTQADISAAEANIENAGLSVSDVISGILAKNPWGTLPASGSNTVTFRVPFYNRVDSFIGKIDQHIGKADLLTGRYFFGDSGQAFPLGLISGGTGAPGFNTVTPTRVNIVSVSYTKVLSNALLLEIRGGYNRFHETFAPQDNFDPTSVGLDTLGANPNSRDFGMPLISVSGFSTIGSNLANPRGRTDQNYQLFGNMTWTRGSHTWKWGYEWRRTTIDGYFDAGFRGKLSFAATDANPDTGEPAWSPLENFLLGRPTGGGRSAHGNSDRSSFENNSGMYLQDSWRASSRLTLNFGLRWDYFGVIGADNNAFTLLRADGSVTPAPQLYPKDLNNFSPRISFAYDLTGKGRSVVRAGWGVFYDAFSQDFFLGQLPWNTFNPGPAYNDLFFTYGVTPQIEHGQPVYLDYLSGFVDPATGIGGDVFTVDQKLRTPYIQNYNLNVEHQFSNSVALQVGYVGSAGRKLFRYRDLNQVQPNGDVAYPNHYYYVNQFESSAASSYNSLQTSFKIRNWHGVTSTLNYTWGHSIDDASDGQDYVPNAAQPDNSFNPRAERASSNFDTRNRIQWFWTYDLPFGKNRLTSGWGINGIVTYSTGQPYNVNYLQFDVDYNGGGEFYGRPDVIGDPHSGTSTPYNFLNLTAFAGPCDWDVVNGDCIAGTQHYGSLPRNAFRGPNYANVDFSLAKKTNLTERLKMELRVDIFNILNHPNFSNPLLPNFSVDMFNNGSDLAVVGGATRVVGTGYLPITATPDVGTGNPFLGGGGPRTMQFGLKFTF